MILNNRYSTETYSAAAPGSFLIIMICSGAHSPISSSKMDFFFFYPTKKVQNGFQSVNPTLCRVEQYHYNGNNWWLQKFPIRICGVCFSYENEEFIVLSWWFFQWSNGIHFFSIFLFIQKDIITSINSGICNIYIYIYIFNPQKNPTKETHTITPPKKKIHLR